MRFAGASARVGHMCWICQSLGCEGEMCKVRERKKRTEKSRIHRLRPIEEIVKDRLLPVRLTVNRPHISSHFSLSLFQVIHLTFTHPQHTPGHKGIKLVYKQNPHQLVALSFIFGASCGRVMLKRSQISDQLFWLKWYSRWDFALFGERRFPL